MQTPAYEESISGFWFLSSLPKKIILKTNVDIDKVFCFYFNGLESAYRKHIKLAFRLKEKTIRGDWIRVMNIGSNHTDPQIAT